MKRLTVICLSFLLLTSCKFYQKHSGNLNKMHDGVLVIETVGKYKSGKEGKMKAIAFPLENNLIVALTHATQFPRERIIFTPLGVISTPLVVEWEKNYLNGKELELVGRENDVSFFRADVEPLCKLGDSDKLELGTELSVMGYSFNRDINFKTGVVSVLDTKDEMYKSTTPLKDLFIHTVPLNPGDSGSPVFAKGYNGMEIVGIANAVSNGVGIGFAIRINVVKEAAKKFGEDLYDTQTEKTATEG